MEIKKCKCGADIGFITMVSGKKMPVDAKPEKMVVVPESTDIVFYGVRQGELVTAYRPHWGTCPLADKFKKGDKKDG